MCVCARDVYLPDFTELSLCLSIVIACSHVPHSSCGGRLSHYFCSLGTFRLSDCFFFFSSRRRHTRSDRDWSSDVCSSDRSEEHTSELQSQAEDGIRDLIVTGVQTCALPIDRKSTRLNSSHDQISYAVFCL